MMINERVQIHKGDNSMGGVFIYEEVITGTIVRVNKKSIRVHMTHAKCTTNGKITREYDMDKEATFDFWKTIDRQFGENAGKTVSLYKNKDYGIIEIAH
jgi:hypothetical protein